MRAIRVKRIIYVMPDGKRRIISVRLGRRQIDLEVRPSRGEGDALRLSIVGSAPYLPRAREIQNQWAVESRRIPTGDDVVTVELSQRVTMPIVSHQPNGQTDRELWTAIQNLLSQAVPEYELV